MAKTDLRDLRIRIVDDPPSGHPKVFASYSYTTSDGDSISKSRDVWENLTSQQQANVQTFIDNVKTRITNAENIS